MFMSSGEQRADECSEEGSFNSITSDREPRRFQRVD